jgi:WD40 repeat protein
MGQGPSASDDQANAFPLDDDLLTNTLDEVTILEGHEDMVRIVCVIDNASLLATASDDCTVRLWDWRSGAPVAVLRGHKRPITCLLKLSAKRLASGSSDERILIWNVVTGQLVRELCFHPTGVQCMIRLGENTIASGGERKNLLVFFSCSFFFCRRTNDCVVGSGWQRSWAN